MSHQTISFIKSFLRLSGYFAVGAFIFFPNPGVAWIAGWVLLLVSEAVGVYEEIGQP